MPLYSDSNYYYSGGSSQLYSPYYSPGVYSSQISSPTSSSYSPYTSTYNRSMGGSYAVPLTPQRSPSFVTSSHGLSSRYQPKLSTITETLPLMGTSRHSSLMPLTRIQSPKFSTYTAPTSSTTTPYVSKYTPPRPILINTADLDVSKNSRFRKNHEKDEEQETRQEIKKVEAEKSAISPSSSLKRPADPNSETSDLSSNEQSELPTERKGARSTIKRNRAVVRLSTIRSRSKDRSAKSSPAEKYKQEPASRRFRDLPQLNDSPEVKISWREKLADDLAAIPTYPVKKSPGDKIRERYFIQDGKTEDAVPIVTRQPHGSEHSIDEVIVEIDPLHHTIRRLSIPQCPTFHQICEDISSDKIDDDLNAGELRRRASLIQEQEQELLNQLQKSPSGSYQLINLERQSSHDSLQDETTRKSKKKRKSKRGSKKIRHKITAIVGIENASLTPVILETEEYPSPHISPKPKFTANVEAVEEHHEIHKIFKLPKKKSIKKTIKPKDDTALPEGFVQCVPKAKSSPTSKTAAKQEKFISTAEIFTFDQMKAGDKVDEEELKVKETKDEINLEAQIGPAMKASQISHSTPKSEKLVKTLVKKPIISRETPTAILQPEILSDLKESAEEGKNAETPKTPKTPKAPITPKTPKLSTPTKGDIEPQSPTVTTQAVVEGTARDIAEISDCTNLNSTISTDVAPIATKLIGHPLEKSQSLNMDIGAVVKPKTIKNSKLSQENVTEFTPTKTTPKMLVQSDPNISVSHTKPQTFSETHVSKRTTPSIASSKLSSESSEDFWLQFSSTENLETKLGADKDKIKTIEEKLVNTTSSITSSKANSECGDDIWMHFSSSENLDAKLGVIKTKPVPQKYKTSKTTSLIGSASKASSESGDDFWAHFGSAENLDSKQSTPKDKPKPKDVKSSDTTKSIASSSVSLESVEDIWSHLSSNENLNAKKVTIKDSKPKQQVDIPTNTTTTTPILSPKTSSERGEDSKAQNHTDAKLIDTDKGKKLKPKEEKILPTKPATTTAVKPKSSTKSTALITSSSENIEKTPSQLTTEDVQPPVATPKPIKKLIQKSDSGEDFWSQIGSRETLYMTNRKKVLLDEQLKRHEEDLKAPTEETQLLTKESKDQQKVTASKIDKKTVESTLTSTKETTLPGQVKTEPKKSDVSKNEDVKKPDPVPEKKISPKKDLSKLQTAAKAKEIKKKTTPPLAKSMTITTTAAATTTSTIVTTTTTATSLPKINSGQAAKSPEQQQNKFATTAPETATTTITTTAPITIATTTTTTTTTGKTITAVEKTATVATAAKAPSNDATQTLINQATTTKKTKTDTVDKKAKETTNNDTSQKGAATIKAQPETKPSKVAEVGKKPSPQKTVPPIVTTTASSTIATAASTTVTTAIKAITTTKTTTTADKPKVSTTEAKTATNIGGKVKTSPSSVVTTAINADNFITFTAPKVSSPINNNNNNNKPKTTAANASSTAKNAAAAIQQQQQHQHKAAMPATNTIASTPATKTTTPATKTTTTVSPTKSTTTTTITITSTSTATDAKTIQTPTIATTAVAQPAKYPDSANNNNNKNNNSDIHNDDDTRSGNNLSKFATVSNLAQCLQDVDADLEDFVPSSAENSDDSSSNYSSIDGCDNLSASMKKKLKQRRKKEKAAEKARFDPQKKIKIETGIKCYVSDEPPRYPLVATPRPLWKREKIVYPPESDDESDSDEEDGSTEETDESEECSTTSEEYEDELNPSGAVTAATGDGKDSNSAIIRMSTCSNDSGFEGGTAPSSPKKMLECDVNCHKKCERLTANMCGVNQKLIVEALASVRRGAQEARESPSTPPSTNPAYRIEAHEEHDETSYTYSQFQKSGRFTAPATVIPRFKTYSVEDFHFLAVLGKGSFGKVLLAELRNTEYYYAVKCLKKDVVLEDDDVDSTLIERKVLALGTKHPYLCHLFCTFQTESHLFFVMEYLNGGDLMFHIQESGRFPEDRARFYGAEIISGLKFLHKKGIIYRDLKLDNVLLDFDGHVRIADFGMCKLQIYLDKTADSFCGTPDYMAPEIIKGEKYNQNVDWWSFGVLLYEMLIGQSPFSGCDEDELFWSICNEIPWFPVYISAEATSILKGLLEKDYTKRIGSQYSLAGDVADHIFFHSIDWNLLEKRQLDPPFKPQVKHPLDTQYFDRVFTRERVRLTPIDKDILHSMDQKQFHGFSYTNPHITLD